MQITPITSQFPSYFGSWGLQNPTTAKVGAFVLGTAMIVSIPYITPLVAGAVVTSVTATGAGLIGFSVTLCMVSLWSHRNPCIRKIGRAHV